MHCLRKRTVKKQTNKDLQEVNWPVTMIKTGRSTQTHDGPLWLKRPSIFIQMTIRCGSWPFTFTHFDCPLWTRLGLFKLYPIRGLFLFFRAWMMKIIITNSDSKITMVHELSFVIKYELNRGYIDLRQTKS